MVSVPPDARLTLKLVTTSVVRGSHQGESHGGVYLIDLEAREVRQVIDWNGAGSTGRAAAGTVACAASPSTARRLHRCERRALSPSRRFPCVGSWRNPYLKHCHEIAVWERRCSSPRPASTHPRLRPRQKDFSWAMHVGTQFRSAAALRSAQGRRTARCSTSCISTTCIAHRRHVRLGTQRPAGCCCTTGARSRWRSSCRRHAQRAPFRDGVLFNDTRPNVLRYAGRGGSGGPRDAVPRYPTIARCNPTWTQAASRARASRADSQCSPTRVVAGGSSPSTISVYDLARNECCSRST
jgi:hypothetical protein